LRKSANEGSRRLRYLFVENIVGRLEILWPLAFRLRIITDLIFVKRLSVRKPFVSAWKQNGFQRRQVLGIADMRDFGAFNAQAGHQPLLVKDKA